jgi:hypothetical protein
MEVLILAEVDGCIQVKWKCRDHEQGEKNFVVKQADNSFEAWKMHFDLPTRASNPHP